jgi:hypothetical protein
MDLAACWAMSPRLDAGMFCPFLGVTDNSVSPGRRGDPTGVVLLVFPDFGDFEIPAKGHSAFAAIWSPVAGVDSEPSSAEENARRSRSPGPLVV